MAPPASVGDAGSIPGLGRSLGGENGSLLQYSCLGNPMDRGAWRAVVHGVRHGVSDQTTGWSLSWMSAVLEAHQTWASPPCAFLCAAPFLCFQFGETFGSGWRTHTSAHTHPASPHLDSACGDPSWPLGHLLSGRSSHPFLSPFLRLCTRRQMWPANATASRGPAASRPAGCSWPSSARWGTS